MVMCRDMLFIVAFVCVCLTQAKRDVTSLLFRFFPFVIYPGVVDITAV